MDENLSEMLKGVLSDPDAMSKIMGAAEGLMGSHSAPKQENADTVFSEEKKEEAIKVVGKTGNEERIALISALRPYLSAERRKNADSLIKMLKMIKLADVSKLFRE